MTVLICNSGYNNRAIAAHNRAVRAEERSQNLESTLTQERLRAQESERRSVYL